MSHTTELPTNSPRLEWDDLPSTSESVTEWNDDGRGYSTQIDEAEESSIGTSAFAYFFVAWALLLLLILTAVSLVMANRCGGRSKENKQRRPDLEAAQTSSQPSSCLKRTKFANGVAFSIMLAGAIVGWAFSVFSIATCQFVDLGPEIPNLDAFLDGNYLYRTTITVYSIGLWSADVTSTSGLEGCVHNILPFFDWQLELSRASAVIASLLGGLLLLTLVILASAPVLRTHIHHLAWPFLLTALFQFMTLSVLGSEYCNEMLGSGSCSVGLGGTASVTAALYWVFMVFVSAFLPLSSNETQK